MLNKYLDKKTYIFQMIHEKLASQQIGNLNNLPLNCLNHSKFRQFI